MKHEDWEIFREIEEEERFKGFRICRCTHSFNSHTEYGTTDRPNGPFTTKACTRCNCWRPKV